MQETMVKERSGYQPRYQKNKTKQKKTWFPILHCGTIAKLDDMASVISINHNAMKKILTS